MGEVFKWILLGITIGYGLHWLVDRLLWAKSQSHTAEPTPQPVATTDTEPQPVAPTTPQEPPTTQTLTDLPGITPEIADKLTAAGICSPSDLAAKTAEEILAALDAQPWDNYDVQAWLSAAGVTPEPTATLSETGLTPEQVETLTSAGITTPAQVAKMDETTLLEAIGAQPWDMIDGQSIIAKAKELA